MSNIVINETCNLKCPYCFADEFVNKSANDITIENFKEAVRFIKTSSKYCGRIGLIGGEPLLHPMFDDFLDEIIKDDEISHCVIYTNGILLNKYIEKFINKKFAFLINLNSPNDIGDNTYSKIINNIEELIDKGYNPRNITLGINLYKLDFDYNYFLQALERFGFTCARLAVTIPQYQSDRKGVSVFKYKELIYNLYVDLMAMGVRPIFDCNKPPLCMWNELEKKKINFFQREFPSDFYGINLTESKCNPVIDILPDLTAIRCFGLSEYTKQDIRNYKSIDELSIYYSKEFDDKYARKCSFGKCESCNDRLNSNCYGGCLSEKILI